MSVSKSRVFLACLSLHSAMIVATAFALGYTVLLAPWDEPLLYLTIMFLFWAYYFHGGVLEIRVYRNDSALHHRLISELSTLKGYYPTPYLVNGNCQTVFAAVGRPNPPVRFVRERVSGVFPDGEICVLDWSFANPAAAAGMQSSEQSQLTEPTNGSLCIPGGETPTSSTPTGGVGKRLSPPRGSATKPSPVVILFHGLTGGSDDSNMHYVTQEINRRGWDVVIPVRRGCGDAGALTVPKYYAYGGLEDTEYVVEYVANKVAGRTLLGVGLSAGSNILANYLGTHGRNSRIAAAISIANGYCWEKGTQAIREHHPVWDAIMSGIALHTLVKRHRILLEHADYVTESGAVTSAAVPVRGLKRVGSQRELDEHISRRLHGFDSLQAFYREQSCEDRLDKIAVPTLFLNALDDPLAHHLNIPVEKLRRNPNTLLITTDSGGHLGWAEGLWPFRNAPTWMDRFIVEGLDSLLRVVEESRAEQCAQWIAKNSPLDGTFNGNRWAALYSEEGNTTVGSVGGVAVARSPRAVVTPDESSTPRANAAPLARFGGSGSCSASDSAETSPIKKAAACGSDLPQLSSRRFSSSSSLSGLVPVQTPSRQTAVTWASTSSVS